MKQEFKYDKLQTGLKIQEKRLAMHLTQEVLAEKAELSLRMITDIERAVAGMSIESMLRICNVLKVTPNDILIPTAQEDSEELKWMMNALRNSSEDVRSCAIDIVRAYLRHN